MTPSTDTHSANRPGGDADVWLDVVSAVDYLGGGQRHGLTVADAIEEALRWWSAGLLARPGELPDSQLTELSWDDPDPLRSALERLVCHLDAPGLAGALSCGEAMTVALRTWVVRMAEQYNDGHHWSHPAPRRQFPVVLVLPFDEPGDAA